MGTLCGRLRLEIMEKDSSRAIDDIKTLKNTQLLQQTNCQKSR